MMATIVKGMNFAGLVDYVNKGRNNSKLLASKDVCTVSRDTIIDSLVHQVKDSNTTISKPVGHIALSWHKNDEPKLDDNMMIKVAQDYMERMGIRDTQYMLVRHYDRDHPHLHIVYNRIDNNGNTITDRNELFRNMTVCKAITQEYGFYMAQGKRDVNRNRLKGKTKTLYRNRDLILAEALKSHSWAEFSERLKEIGIKIGFRYGKNGQGIVGVVFSTKDQSYGGAKLDKDLKFQSLDARFGGELARIAYNPDLHNEASDKSKTMQSDSTFIHHLSKASPTANGNATADSSEPDGTEHTSSNDDATEFALIGLESAMELILQPHQVQIGTGGGGENNSGWRDREREADDETNKYKPRRGRR